MSIKELTDLARLIRYYILLSTSQAGSGHPTSSLSATDLLTALFFTQLRFDLDNPDYLLNDRFILSKGHAAPLLYSLYTVAGVISEHSLLKLRQFNSSLEGHPTPRFKYAEVATGSLGQGLSIGLGMALALKLQVKKLNLKTAIPRVFVLLGDGEMAEGSIWEAVTVASYYQLSNLIGILDVNRLGQSGATMLGWQTKLYAQRLQAFGWRTITIDGHNFKQILTALSKINDQDRKKQAPLMIIAKTVKGKGVSFLEDKEGWHGKALKQEDLKQALPQLGPLNRSLKPQIKKPPQISIKQEKLKIKSKTLIIPYQKDEQIATREAYGEALEQLGKIYPQLLVLDADVKNSTYSEKFQKKYPNRFFQMFIAEQNMIGVALGLAKRGFLPFAATFAAFLTRAFDQIRMSALSNGEIKICGSHAGVSIGEDGASQMGLEDLAMMQTVFNSIVLYPADAVSTIKLTEIMAKTPGIIYLRTTRGATPVIYAKDENFKIGGSKIHRIKIKEDKKRQKQLVTVVAAGITLHEALKAQRKLANEGIEIQVIDCYSIKPIDGKTLREAARHSKAIITVEDHLIHGGLGDAVIQALSQEIAAPVYKLAVTKIAQSGTPNQLLKEAGIDKEAIVTAVKKCF